MSTPPPPAPTSATRMLLPCVGLRFDPPRIVGVYFEESAAVGVLEADRHAEVFNADGFAVTTYVNRFGLTKLQPIGDPVALRERIAATLRASADAGGADAEDAAEIDAVASWIEAAPTVEHALHGLTLTEVVYTELEGPATTHCIPCNPTQRLIWRTPKCCPK